jgi:hypothetical protein
MMWCVASRISYVIDVLGFAADSTFGMLRLALHKTGGQENWKQPGKEARTQRSSAAEDVKEKDVVGVAIRFWDALCFE